LFMTLGAPFTRDGAVPVRDGAGDCFG
jgi:hypothetical protein